MGWDPLPVPAEGEITVRYKDDDVKAIIGATFPRGGPSGIDEAKLRDDLNRVAEAHAIISSYQNRPAPHRVLDELKAITARADELLRLLSSDDLAEVDSSDLLDAVPHDLRTELESSANLAAERSGGFSDFPKDMFYVDGEQFPDWKGGVALHSAIRSVRRLRDWAQDAEQRKQVYVRNTAAARRYPGEGFPLKAEPRHKGDKALDDFLRDLARIYQSHSERRPGVATNKEGRCGGPWPRFMYQCLARFGSNITEQALVQRWKRIQSKERGTNQSAKNS